MRTHAPTRATAVLLLIAAFLATPMASAWAAPVRVKIVTTYSDDPNDPLAVGVGAITVKIGSVFATTGDGTNQLKCLGGTNFRQDCSGPASCPGGTCGNPGDNDGNGTDDEGKGVARTTVPSGAVVVGVPTADLLDEVGGKYRVGSIRIEETVTALGKLCAPASKPEGNVGYQFEDDVDHSSQSDYTVAIRIVPLAAPAVTGASQCSGGENGVSSKALLKCKRTVAKASADFVQARFKALTKCEDLKHAGTFPANLDCRTETKARETIAKESADLRKAIAKDCGGADKTCGGAATNEILPAALGFPKTCPDFRGSGCTNAITDCGGLADCLECIGAKATDRVMVPGTAIGFADPKLQKQLSKCQRTIVKAATTHALAHIKSVSKCLDKRLQAKDNNSLFNTACNSALNNDLTDAVTALKKTICKACGGSEEKGCGGPDDFTPNQIGFPMTCPNTTPGNAGACPAAITSLDDIASCAFCQASRSLQCTDYLPLPSLAGITYSCTGAE